MSRNRKSIPLFFQRKKTINMVEFRFNNVGHVTLDNLGLVEIYRSIECVREVLIVENQLRTSMAEGQLIITGLNGLVNPVTIFMPLEIGLLVEANTDIIEYYPTKNELLYKLMLTNLYLT